MTLRTAITAAAIALAPLAASAAPFETFDIDDVIANGAGFSLPVSASLPGGSLSFKFEDGSVPADLTASLLLQGVDFANFTNFMAELSDQEGFGSGNAVAVVPTTLGVPVSETVSLAIGEMAFFNVSYSGIKNGGWSVDFTADDTSTVIPLPAALPLFAAALAGLGFASRKRRS